MIVNKTRNKPLALHKGFCSNWLTKSIGLMFSKPRDNYGLIFLFKRYVKHSLHMFFVFYPIDVLFLDENKRVVGIKENLKPFRTYTPKAAYMYFIELSEGTVKKTGTKMHDLVVFH